MPGSTSGSVRFRDVIFIFRLRLPAVPVRLRPVPPIQSYVIVIAECSNLIHCLSNCQGLVTMRMQTLAILLTRRIFTAMVSWSSARMLTNINFQIMWSFSCADFPYRRSQPCFAYSRLYHNDSIKPPFKSWHHKLSKASHSLDANIGNHVDVQHTHCYGIMIMRWHATKHSTTICIGFLACRFSASTIATLLRLFQAMSMRMH